MSPAKTTAIALFFLFPGLSVHVFSQQKKSAIGELFIQQKRTTPSVANNGFHYGSIRSPYRSYDGTNNNISDSRKAYWGAADIPLYRELPGEYGSGDPKNAMGGENRPSPRRISNAIVDEPVTQFNERGLSSFVYVWGQFLDHDISLTPTGTTEYVPISLPGDEKVFTEDIPFYRSEVRASTGVYTPREQSNLNTAWIDASMVYGSDAKRAYWLRTLEDGKMKTSAGNFLPFNTATGEQSGEIDPNAPGMSNDGDHTVKTFVAGDVRASEHPGLAALHTLFVREHNRICDRLITWGFKNDEDIYQKARKEVAAIIQAITYQEFLPAIGITLNPYRNYNSHVRPDLTNSFATAGYRLGHTMVADDILLFDNDCNEVSPGEFDLIEVFWNPQLLLDYNPEPFLKGFAAHTQYETDTKINSVLRNFLFGNPNDPVRFGIDLASLNIQRGRDHGLPNYNAVRKYYTHRPAILFSDITANTVLADSLQILYGSVDNIDLWTGILAEDHLPGKSVGNTLHEMLRVQFEKLRDGDYYFYKNDPYLPWLTRFAIYNTKFSDVLKRNTSLTNLQSNVFFTEECPTSEEEEITSSGSSALSTKTSTRIYPNPATDMLNIEIADASENKTIKLITADGILLKVINVPALQKNVQMNVSKLAAGVYFVSVTNKKETSSFKFVKASN